MGADRERETVGERGRERREEAVKRESPPAAALNCAAVGVAQKLPR